ncbi:tetratricopeptide repeat protein [Vibrio nigripulchritudo]|uniref:tetratricopeptide repeat protein n=1 Tax=Vibrio nigripulchritudo TaxID=28173 RepID=UPI0003B1F23D|nr:hypothetical protein [Vibrio nigripulchritudo]CCN72625.1 hypothetical protein VIBNISFn118_630015 [Vibrio nigripulchritudo SFn118]
MINQSFDYKIKILRKKIEDPSAAWEGILSEVENLLVLHPKSPELICMKADLHYELASLLDMSDKERPVVLYKQAIDLDKNNYEANTKLATYLSVVLDDHFGALEYFYKSVSFKKDEDIYLLYAEALANLGRSKEAIEMIRRSQLSIEATNWIIQSISDEYL